MTLRRLLPLAFATALLGCERGSTSSAPAPSAALSASATVPAPVSSSGAPAPLPTGRALVAAGPKLPQEFEDVLLYCDTNWRAKYELCDQYSVLRASRWFKGENSENEVIPLLGDPRAPVRLLAAFAIGEHSCDNGCAYAVDRALSEQLLRYAETEQNDRIRTNLPRIITKIDVSATGLQTRVEALFTSMPNLRGYRILESWLERNPKLFPRLAELAKSPDPKLRTAALQGIGRALGSERHAEACRVYLDAVLAPGPGTDYAASRIVGAQERHRCAGDWNRFITNAGQGIRREPKDFGLLSALLKLYDSPDATPSQKKSILAIAAGVAESTNQELQARTTALSFVARRTPNSVAYLRRFKNNREPKLASVAQEFANEAAETEARALPTEPRRSSAPR